MNVGETWANIIVQPTYFLLEMMVLAAVLDLFGELKDVLERLQLSQGLVLVKDLFQHPGRRRHERDRVARRVRIEATAERHPFYR